MGKYQRHKISYCPICGYVDLTNKESTCYFCNSNLEDTNDFFDELCAQLESTSTDKENVEEYVRQLYVYDDDRFNEDVMSDRENEENVSAQVDYYEELILNNKEKEIRCPICNSNDLSNISNATKVAKVGLFGLLGAGDIGKTYRCNNCGSKF